MWLHLLEINSSSVHTYIFVCFIRNPPIFYRFYYSMRRYTKIQTQASSSLISVTTIGSSITLARNDVRLISSPNWPSYYPPSANRTSIISSPEGSGVKLVVLDLSLESSCSYDIVYLDDGKQRISSITCGNWVFVVKRRWAKYLTIVKNEQREIAYNIYGIDFMFLGVVMSTI